MPGTAEAMYHACSRLRSVHPCSASHRATCAGSSSPWSTSSCFPDQRPISECATEASRTVRTVHAVKVDDDLDPAGLERPLAGPRPLATSHRPHRRRQTFGLPQRQQLVLPRMGDEYPQPVRRSGRQGVVRGRRLGGEERGRAKGGLEEGPVVFVLGEQVRGIPDPAACGFRRLGAEGGDVRLGSDETDDAGPERGDGGGGEAGVEEQARTEEAAAAVAHEDEVPIGGEHGEGGGEIVDVRRVGDDGREPVVDVVDRQTRRPSQSGQQAGRDVALVAHSPV